MLWNEHFDLLFQLQYSNGGTIIAVEVENEYGSYAKDNEYMPVVKEVGLTYSFTNSCHRLPLYLSFTLNESLQLHFSTKCSLKQVLLYVMSFRPQLSCCVQGLLSRGITELLLTSDYQDGL